MNGWVKIHRDLIEWEWYDDPKTFKLFMHILLSANHKENKWHGILIKKGQFLTGRKSLSNDTKLSEQTIRTGLNKLISTNEITIKTTSKYSIIQVQKWEKYQSSNQVTNQQITKYQPRGNHKQEGKNDKNEKNIYDKNYLQTLDEKDITEFTKKFDCSSTQVISTAHDIIDYMDSKGKTYENYKATLSGWLRKTYGEKIQAVKFTPDFPELSEEQRIANITLIEEQKKRYLEINH